MSAGTPSKGTVLLVEDERDTRELLAGAVTRAGYRCVTAGGAVEALERAAIAGFIDVVVTDVVLGTDDRGGLRLIGGAANRRACWRPSSSSPRTPTSRR